MENIMIFKTTDEAMFESFYEFKTHELMFLEGEKYKGIRLIDALDQLPRENIALIKSADLEQETLATIYLADGDIPYLLSNELLARKVVNFNIEYIPTRYTAPVYVLVVEE